MYLVCWFVCLFCCCSRHHLPHWISVAFWIQAWKAPWKRSWVLCKHRSWIRCFSDVLGANQAQGLLHSWLWGTDSVCLCVCVFVMWTREQEKGSHHHQPLFLWHTWAGSWSELDPKPWVLESEEKQAFGDFHKKSAFSSALNFLVMPHWSQKKNTKLQLYQNLHI